MGLIGAILGDIAGSQFEAERCENPSSCEIFSNRCEFTDDTVTSLGIKLACDTGFSFTDSLQMVGRNHPLCGYAPMFEKWIFSDTPEPYGSWGNGSAMRVSYIGEKYDNYEDVVYYATESAKVSHNDAEGIKGAVTTAVCIYMAKIGCSKKEIEEYILGEYPPEIYDYSLDKSIDWLRKNYTWSVKCQDSVPVAVKCFLESTDYESFLRNIFSLDCDTDTLACIGGGIAESFYKTTGFNNRELLERYLTEDLIHVLDNEARYLVKHNNKNKDYPRNYWSIAHSDLGLCYAYKGTAYKFTKEDITGELGAEMKKMSTKMEIEVF